MHDETTARMRTLAAEYIALVELMRGGQYADAEEWQALSSQRMLTHDALIRLTGVTDRPAMYGYCRALLAGEVSPTAAEG